MADGVYWIGQDNNVYAKSSAFEGVKNVGSWAQQQQFQQQGLPSFISGYQRIDDPVVKSAPQNEVESGPVSGGGGGDPYAAERTAYVGQLQTQLDQLGGQEDIGLSNIRNSYNRGANRLDQQKGIAERNYKTNDQQNTRSYLNNRNGIVNNTRAQANALQRLLGLNGAGNSSAAYEQAPYAAALEGSTQINEAQTTYGGNKSKLDTSWQDTLLGHKNSMEDLKQQRYSQENGLRASIAQTRATLLDKIATAQNTPGAFNNEISSLLEKITGLGKQYANPVMRTADVKFAAPNMDQWFLNGGQGAQVAPTDDGGAASDLDPTFLGMLGEERDEYGNPIQA